MESLRQSSVGRPNQLMHTLYEEYFPALTTALSSVRLVAGTLTVEFIVLSTGKLLGGLGAVVAADGGAGEAKSLARADKSTLGEHFGGDNTD